MVKNNVDVLNTLISTPDLKRQNIKMSNKTPLMIILAFDEYSSRKYRIDCCKGKPNKLKANKKLLNPRNVLFIYFHPFLCRYIRTIINWRRTQNRIKF